jgi:hypothetical protein
MRLNTIFIVTQKLGYGGWIIALSQCQPGGCGKLFEYIHL